MDIYEFAMEKEHQSADYYRDLAQQCNNEGLTTIFTMLAEEEEKHFHMVQAMRERGRPEPSESTVLKDAVSVLRRMSKERDAMTCQASQVDLYKKAQEFEEESENYYKEKAGEIEDTFQKKLLTNLAEHEHRHYMLLETIIQMVLRPERWLENAEWTHLEEY